MSTGVYCILNVVNGKRYVGSAAVSLRRRLRDRWTDLRANQHKNKHLQAAWNKYGFRSFRFSVLEKCEPEKCLEREQFWIDHFQSADQKNGYNHCPAAGSWLGAEHQEEAKEKIRRLWKREGHREMVAEKNRESAKKQWADPERRAEMSRIKMEQYTQNDGIKEKVSAAAKNQWAQMSQEDRQRSLESMLAGNRKLRGECRYNSVLTEEIVREACSLRRQGWTYKSLQKRYGCGFITIHKAVVGTTWSHL